MSEVLITAAMTYAMIAVVVFGASVLVWKLGSHRDTRRKLARVALAAPIWPAVLLLIARGLVRDLMKEADLARPKDDSR